MSLAPAPAPANHVQWYYPAPTGTPATPFHLQHSYTIPPPASPGCSILWKVGYIGRTYMNEHYSSPQVYPASQWWDTTL
ncbi:hypothetical protein C1H46_014852 [Malus baccata]|uniref:Uncharacterized protein n=1 Tax=Malus baccata TaxID=106549 RepID=A0A540ML25_MALBA|nr:hypothetical protein C1H46_014852 [Malus baccata]